MFFRLSPIFVFMLSFDFGSLKSIANVANSNVSDNSLGNIEHIAKFSDINSTNFPSNESNINAGQRLIPTEEMFLRFMSIGLMLISQSGLGCGRQQGDDENRFLDAIYSPTNYNGPNFNGPVYIINPSTKPHNMKKTRTTTISPEPEYQDYGLD